MFNNIGVILKKIGLICFFLIFLSFLVGGIVILITFPSTLKFIGFLVIMGGSLISLIIASLFYGFGQLIINTQIICEYEAENNELLNSILNEKK